MKNRLFTLSAAVVAAGFVTLASAQEMVDSTTITATTDAPAQTGDFGPEHTLDGLTEEGFRNGDPADPDGIRPGGHQGTHWITNDIAGDADGNINGSISFDLGGTYDLVSLRVLNTSNTNWNDRETDVFTIETSTDSGATFSVPSEPVTLQDYIDGFQEVPLLAEGVTNVRLNLTNDPLLGTVGGADRAIGLNEVEFFFIPGADSDNDNMLDSWEIENFGDLSRDGTEDEDLPAPDGLTNLEEHDAMSDPKDPDSDDDGLNDGDEVNVHMTDPTETDSDGDDLDDGAEVNTHMTDPADADSDDDDLNDGAEVTIHMTNPNNPDTDGDSRSDGFEVANSEFDPLVAEDRGTLIDPTTITATADSTSAGDFGAENLIDDTTLEGFQNTGDPGPPVRLAQHQGNHWLAADDSFEGVLTFDLGGSYSLARLEVLNTSNTNWNDSETDTFTIATSTDGGNTYSQPSAPVPLQPYLSGFQAVPLVVGGVTHVQLAVTNSDDTVDDPNNNFEESMRRVGLNEVRFFTGSGRGFQIVSVTYVPGSTTANITWESTPGVRYVVEYNDDLDGPWDEVEDSAIGEAGAETTTIPHFFAPAEPATRRYYRVRLGAANP